MRSLKPIVLIGVAAVAAQVEYVVIFCACSETTDTLPGEEARSETKADSHQGLIRHVGALTFPPFMSLYLHLSSPRPYMLSTQDPQPLKLTRR